MKGTEKDWIKESMSNLERSPVSGLPIELLPMLAAEGQKFLQLLLRQTDFRTQRNYLSLQLVTACATCFFDVADHCMLESVECYLRVLGMIAEPFFPKPAVQISQNVEQQHGVRFHEVVFADTMRIFCRVTMFSFYAIRLESIGKICKHSF